jgi:AcrR family transcriptional regulator
MMSPAAGPLPRGRHNLSRAEVVGAQRDRMMLAMAEAMIEKGYVGTSVADVISRAGVSRETFYQQFLSKLDCFLGAFENAAAVLFAKVVERGIAGGADDDRLARFDRLLHQYLEALIAEPAFARLFLVEVYAAGPEAIARRIALQATIVDRLAAVLDLHDEADRFAAQALVVAIGGLVTGPLVSGDLDAIRALQAPLVDLARRLLGE